MSDTNNQTIVLADKWDIRARAIPGAYWDRDAGSYVLHKDSVTGRAAIVALKLFPQLALRYPELERARDAMAIEVRPFDNATEFNTPIAATTYVESKLEEMESTFYEFQSLDLGYLAAVIREHHAAYIGWERGLGKTLAGFALAENLSAQRTLVVCSNTAKQPVWGDEAEVYWPYGIEVLPNVARKREQCLSRVERMLKAGAPVLLIVHYESLAIIANKIKSGKGWNRYGEWDLVIADEAHRFKNTKAKQTRALKKIPAKHKLALSGSIIENHAEELFSPLQWLFPDRYRSKWRDWNDRYLDYVENGQFGKICVGVRLDQLENMQNELGVFMVHRRKKDELNLPKLTRERRLIQLSPTQRAAYDELQATCITRLDDDTPIVGTEGLVMLTRLRQIATGLDLFSNEVRDSSKMDFATDMIQANEDGVFVVFSWFKAAARGMQARLLDAGIESFVVDGDVKPADRTGKIRAFMEGQRRVFIGTLSTLGESVNLQRANNAIFLDRSWNPGLNVQAIDRIYRIGQANPVTVTDLVAAGTVDEYNVDPAIRNKEALRALILGAS